MQAGDRCETLGELVQCASGAPRGTAPHRRPADRVESAGARSPDRLPQDDRRDAEFGRDPEPCCGRGFATIRPLEVYTECALARSPMLPFDASRMETSRRRGIDGMLTSAVLQTVGFCTRHPWPVIVIAAMLAIGSALYTVTHFAITTDTDQLLPQDLPWRQHEQAYRDAFPQDQILVVVQGPTTELVEMAADRLAAELRTRHDRFSSVRRPQGSEFLQRSALLFPPVDQVMDTAGRLAAAKPLIEVLGADPSLRGVMRALTIGIGAGQARHLPPDALAGPMNMLSDTLDDLFAGRFSSFSWRVLMNGKPAAPDEPRGLIQIEPKLDFGALEPGRAAIDAIRQAADELELGPMFGARVRLTGQVAINDEQFVTLRKGMLPNLAGTVLAVLLILWLALRSAHINLAVFVCLCVGFVVTAAAGLLMVGAL